MRQLLKDLFLTNRFFAAFGGVIALFLLAFPIPALFPIALAGFCLAMALWTVDLFLLFRRPVRVLGNRRLPRVFSLGDDNRITLELGNRSPLSLRLTVIDELPFQFQIRDFRKVLHLQPGERRSVVYHLRPLTRGAYAFGATRIYASTRVGLIQRRFSLEHPATVPVYPSIIQMKQYTLRAFNRVTAQKGIKRIRRIGHSYEFEQIKNYVRGDDYRSVNWKATGRHATLMVNQYEDERAQQIYCLIDKGRAMRMPFGGLSLMDYAINTTLAISNIVLRKHDKAGLVTFSDKIGSTIRAERKANQLNKILQALYRESERPLESNFELLYQVSRKLINGRSLLLLFTNFESAFALDRVLPILRRINSLHLLVVVFFENTEVQDFIEKEPQTIEGIYTQTIARKFIAEKRQMVQKLQQFGIQAILTRPEDLTLQTLNKYLELKSRGLI